MKLDIIEENFFFSVLISYAGNRIAEVNASVASLANLHELLLRGS